ncbi:MAG: carboxypeptidase regulatory-like domain-containing protein [Armatimonadetes bacterium]|nr:carboxypeptidase regulatory-like domain-containing protein [Armatimonadota bacterium]
MGLDGRPVAAARVAWLGSGAIGDTDEQGRFELTRTSQQSPLNCVVALAHDSDLAPAICRDPISSTGPTLVPDLVLRPGVKVHGQVVAADTGAPAAAGRVRVTWESHGPMLNGRTEWPVGPDGRFEARLPPGRYEFNADGLPEPCAPSHWWRDGETLSPDETERAILLRVPCRRSLAGVVCDGAGKPVADARVAVEGQGDLHAATTDADGRYQLKGLLPGQRAYLAVEGYGVREKVTVGIEDVATTPQPLVIRVQREPLVAMTACVVDPWGRPLPGLALRLSSYRLYMRVATRFFRGVTDAAGLCRFDDVDPASTLFLRVQTAGWHRLGGGRLASDANSARLTDLVVAREGAILRGRAVDAGEQPAAGAVVYCLEARDRQAVCDAHGGFVLRDVPVAPLRLVALHGARQVGRANAEPGDDPVLRVAEPTPRSAGQSRRLALDLLRRVGRGPEGQDTSVVVSTARALAALDPPSARALVSQLTDSEQQRIAVVDLLRGLALRAPDRLAGCLELLDLLPSRRAQAMLSAELAATVPRTHPKLVATLDELAQDAWPAGPRSPGAVRTLLCFAAAADALGRPEAPEILDRAVAFARDNGKEPNGLLAGLAFLLAGHPELLVQLLEQVDGDAARVKVLSVLIEALAEHDPARAVAYWRTLPPSPVLRVTCPWYVGLDDVPPDEPAAEAPDLRARIGSAIYPALARVDLRGALEMVRRQSSAAAQYVAPTLLRAATPDQRMRIIRLLTDPGWAGATVLEPYQLMPAVDRVDPALAERWRAELSPRAATTAARPSGRSLPLGSPNEQLAAGELELGQGCRRWDGPAQKMPGHLAGTQEPADWPEDGYGGVARRLQWAAARISATDVDLGIELAESMADNNDEDARARAYAFLQIAERLMPAAAAAEAQPGSERPSAESDR